MIRCRCIMLGMIRVHRCRDSTRHSLGTVVYKETHGKWSTLSMGSDCAWIASIAVECSSSRFFPDSSALLRAAALLCEALKPAAAVAALDLEGLLPFSSASSLAA